MVFHDDDVFLIPVFLFLPDPIRISGVCGNLSPLAIKKQLVRRDFPFPIKLEPLALRAEMFRTGAATFAGSCRTFITCGKTLARRVRALTGMARTITRRAGTFTGCVRTFGNGVGTFTGHKKTFTRGKKTFCVRCISFPQVTDFSTLKILKRLKMRGDFPPEILMAPGRHHAP
ncbi:MAG: hypothetical protein ABIT37_06870 [Luteolibacter sp.]